MKKILILVAGILCSSCAMFVPPTGGEKDITPPKLVKSFPENKTINFKGKTIELEFDEVIDPTSLKQDLLIIPEQNGAYAVKQTSKGVKLVFDKAFKDSTTYTLNFRNGIKDINERNPARNLKLVFSTGSEIDSLSITGKLEDVWTKEPVLDYTVGLYNLTDTIPILKRKPDYFTKTDSMGNYLFENIKNNQYRLIAFKDKNQNLLFDQKTDPTAFLPDTINLTKNETIPVLGTYKSDLTKNKVKRTIARENTFVVQMERNLRDFKIEYLDKKDTITYNVKTNEITFFNNPPVQDTLKVKFITTDSLLRSDSFEQKIYFNKPATAPRRKTLLPLPISAEPKSGEGVFLPVQHILSFETPITRIDTQKISLLSDTLALVKPELKWLDKNNTELQVSFKPTARESVTLRIKSNAFENFKGDTSAVFNLKNAVLKKEDTGVIEGQTKIKGGNKIAQLIKSDTREIVREIKFTDSFRFDSVIPDLYDIRIIIDANGNGMWDTGDFINNILPEQVLLTKEPVKLKANFEIKDIAIE